MKYELGLSSFQKRRKLNFPSPLPSCHEFVIFRLVIEHGHLVLGPLSFVLACDPINPIAPSFTLYSICYLLFLC